MPPVSAMGAQQPSEAAMLKKENAALQEQLDKILRRKQEKAKAKLARLQDKLALVNELKEVRAIHADLQKRQENEIHKLESQLRLQALELYTGAVNWDIPSAPHLWGPEIKSRVVMHEPGSPGSPIALLESFRIHISRQPFAIGAMRLAYHAVTATGRRLVVKRLLSESADSEVNVAAFKEDVNAHRVAVKLAAAFNAQPTMKGMGVRLVYGPLYIVKVPCLDAKDSSEHPTVLLLEQYLDGKFTKWNNNRGQVHGSDDPIPQAFSHYTHVYSGRKKEARKLVADIQGVAENNLTYNLTDPAVHSEARDGPTSYGVTDCGKIGVQNFFSSHRCNSICTTLGLPTQR